MLGGIPGAGAGARVLPVVATGRHEVRMIAIHSSTIGIDGFAPGLRDGYKGMLRDRSLHDAVRVPETRPITPRIRGPHLLEMSILSDDATPVGAFFFHRAVSCSNSVFLSYFVARPYRGRGYGRAGGHLALRVFRSRNPAVVVHGVCEARNIASRALLERLGFCPAGVQAPDRLLFSLDPFRGPPSQGTSRQEN